MAKPKTVAQAKIDEFEAANPETTPEALSEAVTAQPVDEAPLAAPQSDSDAFAAMVGEVDDIPSTGTMPPAPRINWLNGQVSTRKDQPSTPGDFYSGMSGWARQPEAPWRKVSRFDEGDGYATPTLKIAPLVYRSQPFFPVKDSTGKVIGRNFVPASQHWEAGMSIYTEILCFVEGYDGIVLWTMTGMTGKAVTGKGGIIPTYRQGLLASASSRMGKALPLGSFWLPISNARRPDGGIAFEDTGHGSYVTPPALFLPDNPMTTLFVGRERMLLAGTMERQFAAWQKERRGADEYYDSPAPQAAQRQLPPARNAVDVIEEF